MYVIIELHYLKTNLKSDVVELKNMGFNVDKIGFVFYGDLQVIINHFPYHRILSCKYSRFKTLLRNELIPDADVDNSHLRILPRYRSVKLFYREA